MRKLVWFLIVLAVLAVGADRGADYLAERTLATQVQQRAGLPRTPQVQIAGFPFLTQLYDGRFDQVTMTAAEASIGRGDRTVSVDRLRLVFSDVTTDRRFRTFEAASGRATARIPYAELSRLLGLQVRYAGQGAVRATARVEVAGQTFRPSFTLQPKVLDGALQFGGRFGQALPAPVRAEVQRLFGVDVPLDRLPFGIRATGLTARPGGVVLQLSGKDLRYTRQG